MSVRNILGTLLAAWVLAPVVAWGAPPSLSRFAIVIGANYGGTDRPQLQYAESDARAFGQVLEELGGIPADHRRLLVEPDLEELTEAFGDIGRRVADVKGEGQRTEVLVYYSGHSDEHGLLLGGERLAYPALKRHIEGLDADVRIAVLDSCSSGALTRAKGGVHRPPFLSDASVDLEGYAFLTSSAPDEASQESDRIGASFFTHYLVSALRGAADASRDGKVTLNEAYEFAFHETLARTEGTRIGAQHAAYDIRLTGSGDLVITDLRQTSAGLELGEDVAGRLFVRDGGGRLMAELRKAGGEPVELKLPPGEYGLTLDSGGRKRSARVVLEDGRSTRVARADLAPTVGEVTTPRGPAPAPEPEPQPEPAAEVAAPVRTSAYDRVWVSATLLPPISTHPGESDDTLHHLAFNALVGTGARLQGFELGGLLNWRTEHVDGIQLSGLGNRAGGRVRGLQIAGLGNVSGHGADALQIGGVANVAGGPLRGVQLAGATNVATGAALGIQASGALNVSDGALGGLQVSGGVNVATGEVSGGQIGVVNVGENVYGAQIGVVNVADRVWGVQAGLINVSTDVLGVPIGLVNYVAEGQRDLMVWVSGRPLANGRFGNQLSAGFKFGSRFVHTLVMVGSRSATLTDLSDAADDWSAGVGLGGHIPLRGGVSFDIDLVSSVLGPPPAEHDPLHLVSQLRLTAGVDVLGLFGLFVGAAAVHEFTEPRREAVMAGAEAEAAETEPFERHRFYPEVFFGLRI